MEEELKAYVVEGEYVNETDPSHRFPVSLGVMAISEKEAREIFEKYLLRSEAFNDERYHKNEELTRKCTTFIRVEQIAMEDHIMAEINRCLSQERSKPTKSKYLS